MATLVACASPGADDDLGIDDPSGEGGKDDNGSSRRFTEVDATHTNQTFRTYIERALDELAASDREVARYTAQSIADGRVRIDELSDLTCADFLHVINDLPDLHLKPSDYASLKRRGNPTTAAISAELDGYMWSNRIYVARGMSAQHVAATLVHETNHVVNRSEVGYYDDLPTSAFIHEYRAFYVERTFDPDSYAGIDLVDYVITNYELDRSKIRPEILAHPLTPKLLPTPAAWQARDVSSDVPEPATCQ
ncbi:MAG TPA: hypothetical protein VMZ53_20255 [Kofleriaceae bacterium]|nr:hypothetical protein [Kofleriaceae bacterium]